MTDRRRNTFVLLIVAALLRRCRSLVVVGLPGVVKAKKTRLGLDLKGGVELVYQGKPTAQSKVNAESLERTIDIMRKRVDQLGVAQPEIQRSGADEIDVALPDVSNVERAEEEVGKTAQLYFYDWEPNVIGPDGKPASDRTTVTGGESAGASQLRAARVPSGAARGQAPGDPAQERHDLAGAARPHRSNGCIYGSWYLLDTKHEKMLCAGDRGLRAAETEATCTPTATSRRAGVKAQGGARQPGHGLVQARPVEGASGKVTQPQPEQLVRAQRRSRARRAATSRNPQQSFDEGAGDSGQPNVTFGFTSHGKKVFER